MAIWSIINPRFFNHFLKNWTSQDKSGLLIGSLQRVPKRDWLIMVIISDPLKCKSSCRSAYFGCHTSIRRKEKKCRRNYVHFIGKINVTKLLYFFVTRERSGRVLAIEFESLALSFFFELMYDNQNMPLISDKNF